MELLKSQIFTVGRDDKRVALINAAKPFLDEQMIPMADQAIQMLGLMSFLGNMQNKGGKKKKKKRPTQNPNRQT